jgi:hypothetical protein
MKPEKSGEVGLLFSQTLRQTNPIFLNCSSTIPFTHPSRYLMDLVSTIGCLFLLIYLTFLVIIGDCEYETESHHN